MNQLHQYMREALLLAREAANDGEVPVGAIIVKNGIIVGRGRNRRESDQNALAHAEIEAINNACHSLGGWRLEKCDLYVTLEPCPMCTGAIINARIQRIIFGAYDSKSGSCGSVVNLCNLSYNHHPEILSGIMEQECANELKNFFQKLRKNIIY